MMYRRILSLLLALLLGMLAAPPARSQQGTEAALSGFVRVAGSNQVPPGTVISLQSDAGEIIQQMTPEGSGRFVFGSLRRQLFYVSARAPGYREVTQRADLFSISHLTVVLTLVPDSRGESPQAPPGTPPVNQRDLRVPDNARKEFERGAKTIFEKHDPARGLEQLRKAIEIFPGYYEAYLLIGTTYMDQEKWEEASAALKRCLELNDKFAPCLGAMGALFNRQGKPAEAEPLLKRSVELAPDAWQGHFDLAQSLLAQGKIAEAESQCRRAHELQPKFPLVHVVLANIVLRKNDLKTARQEYQHFLDSAPESPLAPQVKAKVKELDNLLRAQSTSPPPAEKPRPQ